MGFFSQLTLLTWKNLSLRRRQKIRLLIELVWPVLLFLIIALVRMSQMPIPHEECHFVSKALPSGGLLPFFQSFLCDFESKCFQNETYGEQMGKVNNYRDAGLTILLHDVELIVSNKTTMEALKNIFGNLAELDRIQQSLDRNFDQDPGSEQFHRDALKLSISLTNKLSELGNFDKLIDDLNLIAEQNDTDTLVCGSVGEMIDFTNISLGSSGAGQGLGAFGDLLKSAQGSGPIKPPSAQSEKSRDSGGDLQEPKSDCEWVQEIKSTDLGELMWEKLKPMVQGYILYTPDTNATRRIMREAEQPFASMRLLVGLAKKWQKYSPVLRKYIKLSPISNMVKEFQENPLQRTKTMDSLERNSPADLRELQKFVEVNSNRATNITVSWMYAIDAIDAFANTTLDILECVNLDKVRGFSTEEDFEDAANMLQRNHTFWGGVVFEGFNSSADNDTIPNHVVYQLRMDSSMVRSTDKYKQPFWYPGPMNDVLFYGEYLTGGFVFLQDMLDQGIIKASLRKEDSGAGTFIQEFPYPCYVDDLFINSLGAALPLFMVLAWIFSVAMTIKGIVLEKELRLKEVMKVMGMGDGVHWVAWFINSFLVMFISCCLLVVVLKVGKITINTDASVLLFMLVSFSVSTITFCFLISSLFSQANLSAACGAVIFFITYVPYTMAFSWDALIPLPVKFVLCLSNTMAFGYSSQFVSLFEIQSSGVQWNNIREMPISTGESMTFLQVIGMMWLDAALYMLLTWYIEGVFPGTYGIPRPFYFPFQRSYWCGAQTLNAADADVEFSSKDDIRAVNADFEQEPTHLKLGASISSLYKVYKTGKKVAVNNLSINFYEGQITSFLGHNGAGKTTTMSILTGLFPPTSGTAYIYGKDIMKDISGIRKSLGMCPQHNVLFDYLTVAEHLWFYAKVKGARKHDIAPEMEQMLKHLHLQHKRNELVDNLSGGMKRKLSIAIAFVAGSKMVILDEPTAGVDPYARREIWELLGSYKEGRTIIMSTHHMDEADVLGDRIAIISAGQLRCSGSSLFLKSRFGNGYYLVLNKKMPGNDEPVSSTPGNASNHLGTDISGSNPTGFDTNQNQVAGAVVERNTGLTDVAGPDEVKVALESEGDSVDLKKMKSSANIPDYGTCQESVVSSFIRNYLPGAALCENLGTELSYILPPTATSNQGSFELLFKDLDEYRDQLYISSFGISDTSLEEVFLSVTDDVGVFLQGETTQGTDAGNLPRPFMGRGSLKRRSYQLPAKSSSVKERRNRSLKERRHKGLDSDEQKLLSNMETDMVATEDSTQPELGEAISLHSIDLNADSTDGGATASPDAGNGETNRWTDREANRLIRQKASKKLRRQYSHQTSQSKKIHRGIGQQLSRKLMRKTSHQEPDVEEGRASITSLRMPDAEACEPCPQGLTGHEEKGLNLIRRQFYALIVKRFHHFRRSMKGFFAQVILPVLFVCVAMVFAVTEPVKTAPDKLPLVPWLTGSPNYIFYSNDDPTYWLSEEMEDSVTNDNPGIGTRCMDTNQLEKNGFSCQPEVSSDWETEAMDPDLYEKFVNDELTCSCNGKGFEVCLPGSEGPHPPERTVPTTDILQNFTDMEISLYLRKTTLDTVWQRFGGVSFLETDEMAPLTLNISEEILADWPIMNTSLSRESITAESSLLPDKTTLEDMYTVLLSLARYKNVKVWWDNNGYHALPAFINVASNMLLRGHLQEPIRDEYGITAYSHPINMTGDQIQDRVMKQMPIIMGTAIFVVFALAFIPASFIIFLISERETKSKHLQIVSGISSTTYWVTTLLWDLVNYLIPAILTVVVFLCFNQQAYVSVQALPVTVVLLLLYGWAITPMTYPASFVFSTPSTAYLGMACGTMLVGSLCIMTTFILEFLGGNDESTVQINESMRVVFLIFPPFCLGRGLMDMAITSLVADLSSEIGTEFSASNPWAWEITGRNMVALGIEGVAFFVLTLLIENKFFLKPRHIESEHGVLALEDNDVARERQRVLSGAANDDIVRVTNLTKDYNTTRGIFTAVDRMCVGIPYGECFGLLGVNGAGKTTTFKMLTGDTMVTSGSAYVKGYSILKEMKKVRSSIGYCPQFDALNELLTAEEHLAFYARLRGIPEADINKVVQWGVRKLGLSMYAKRVAGTYSGGNKRKLSTAIALIGDPQLVFLDEPTAGMDPKARRFLWNRITNIIKEGRSVILTSHSMEECEALCTRVAIMVNGKFKCIGSTQHLKTKFGDGYTITIRVGGDPPQMEPLMVFVAETFPYTVLRERHFNMVEYQLPSASASLAKIFGAFDANKQRFCIEDYSVSQTTLDQVFINFAKEQTAGMDDAHQAKAMELTLLKMADGQLQEGDQILVSPDTGMVQILPDNSTIGGFAFAAANIFGGVITHDDQPGGSATTSSSQAQVPSHQSDGSRPGWPIRQDSRGVVNPGFQASGRLNATRASPAATDKTGDTSNHSMPKDDTESTKEESEGGLGPQTGQNRETGDGLVQMSDLQQVLMAQEEAPMMSYPISDTFEDTAL